ncbi:hypothetical protein [Vogesella sp. LIG4]|uniref:hypothetical protein n=1 Tax=Vogesella sp. LIG4 TaxID=1192162 RepID=UPI00081FF09D|nr:hypothetical protein [Vogesella sp. LIG4]SCK22095.1 hypothetical protein PSELUDRAFT_2543 [Vogesella sp. LIG4]
MAAWLPRPRLAVCALLALAVHAAALLWPLAPAASSAPATNHEPGGPLAVTLHARAVPHAAPLPPLESMDSGAEQAHALAQASAPVEQLADPPVEPPVEASAALPGEAGEPQPAAAPSGGGFDPYYPASELDVLAAPIGQLLLDFPRVAPQELQLELYIGSDGAVDRVAVIAGNADSDYARYVMASFRQALFVPAQKGGVAVRSRKHIRVALQQP